MVAAAVAEEECAEEAEDTPVGAGIAVEVCAEEAVDTPVGAEIAVPAITPGRRDRSGPRPRCHDHNPDKIPHRISGRRPPIAAASMGPMAVAARRIAPREALRVRAVVLARGPRAVAIIRRVEVRKFPEVAPVGPTPAHAAVWRSAVPAAAV